MQLRSRKMINANTSHKSSDLGKDSTTLSMAEKVSKVDVSAVTVSVLSVTGSCIVAFQIVCEVLKQISGYSVQYFNNGKYPVPQTAMVVNMELLKLLLTVLRLRGELPSFSVGSFHRSFVYLIPSILYAFNNNIYLYAITLVTPPIWLILCSMRTVITATVYRVILKRPLAIWQYVGILLIVSSIIIAKVPELIGRPSSVNIIPLTAFILAVLASSISACAAIYTEILFKRNSENTDKPQDSFLIKQFWIYFYGVVVSLLLHIISTNNYGIFSYAQDISGLHISILSFYISALLCGSVGGIAVASTLKFLDNIVKEYSGSFANIITAILCGFFFPDKFQITVYVAASLISLIKGIYLYETYKIKE